jgi:hypothetical protein
MRRQCDKEGIQLKGLVNFEKAKEWNSNETGSLLRGEWKSESGGG